MTFYVTRGGFVTLPDKGWFSNMLAARRELDAIPQDIRFEEIDTEEGRSGELHELLDDLEGAKLRDSEGGVVEGLHLAFMHFDDETRRLILAVIIDGGTGKGPYSTPFDRLFEGQYNPEELRLTEFDTPYVIVRVGEDGQPIGPTTVVQPVAEGAPEGVFAAAPLPPDFIVKLLQLAA